MTRQKLIGCALALFVLATLPAAAMEDTIINGIDVFTTPADGTTYFEFRQEPIPAGFFCSKSKPFTGRVNLRGTPIVTADNSLRRTDTIVQRLDDAVFNEKGVAVTRIQLRALQLESIAPIKTACGRFNVRVKLDGDQPITTMRILRENENGGRFLANVGVRARVSFIPVEGKARERLEITRSVRFQPNPKAVWSLSPRPNDVRKSGFVLVDTDADGRTDTFLPGTSNFVAGLSSDKIIYLDCHYDPGCGDHCQGPAY
ncbi:MAG TPA: hypothetical protein VMW27_29225 [Thermoanaerobaculia bacterium]|nr:hypothetical protein [Thermoanaerobaculia bacterium]